MLSVNLTNWINKYYYMRAELLVVTLDKNSIPTELRKWLIARNSFEKWMGLRKHVLDEHKLKADSNCLVGVADYASISIANVENCSLCQEFYDSTLMIECTNCPLYKIDNYACKGFYPTNRTKFTPFRSFVSNQNPNPMIKVLGLTVKSLYNDSVKKQMKEYTSRKEKEGYIKISGYGKGLYLKELES